MSSAKLTKICRICFSEIDSRARKCPHCLSLQGALHKWVIGIVLLLVIISVGGAIGFDIRKKHLAEGQAPLLAEQIKILSSAQFFIPAATGESVAIVGKLRNTSSKHIHNFVYEVQFMNKDDALIDSFHGTEYQAIDPGQEISFKFDNYETIHLPKEQYASYKVIVREAYERD